MVALEVPGVPRAYIHPLEIPNEDPLEVRLVADAIVQEEFEPCSNMFPHIDGEVLNDEVVIIHSFGSVGEPEVLEPYTRVRLPSVLGDVGGWSEALWEQHSLDAAIKGPWPRAVQVGAPVVQSATMPRMCLLVLLGGLSRTHAVRTRCHSEDIGVMLSLASSVDDTTSMMVWSKLLTHM